MLSSFDARPLHREVERLVRRAARPGALGALPFSVNGNAGIGAYQSWQDLTASRALATTYTNTTGRTLAVSARVIINSGAFATLTISGLVQALAPNQAASGVVSQNLQGIVPPEGTYIVTTTGGTLLSWMELR